MMLLQLKSNSFMVKTYGEGAGGCLEWVVFMWCVQAISIFIEKMLYTRHTACRWLRQVVCALVVSFLSFFLFIL